MCVCVRDIGVEKTLAGKEKTFLTEKVNKQSFKNKEWKLPTSTLAILNIPSSNPTILIGIQNIQEVKATAITVEQLYFEDTASWKPEGST